LGWCHMNIIGTIKFNCILLKLMICINNHWRWLQYTFFDMELDHWNEVCGPHLRMHVNLLWHNQRQCQVQENHACTALRLLLKWTERPHCNWLHHKFEPLHAIKVVAPLIKAPSMCPYCPLSLIPPQE
jgi:hypothetical protein